MGGRRLDCVLADRRPKIVLSIGWWAWKYVDGGEQQYAVKTREELTELAR